MAIQAITLPDSAAINYGENDVRHFTEGDAMDVPGLSRPTRHLAQRDVALAQKLNEVVEVVNNKEQFVPLPILRTTMPPNAEEIIQNFRIPTGFECRVLNAVVTSIPASSSAELDIYYQANSYGNSTGTQIISTSTEYTGGTNFFSSGELIITLKNRGGSTLEMIASVMLTMRPVGATSGFLLASAAVGPVGPPGPAGPPGGSGGAGPTGPAGTPGLVWQGDFLPGTTYDDKAVVYYEGSSFKSKVAGNLGHYPVGGISDLYWDFLAEKGGSLFVWKGQWSPATTYVLNDAVQYLGSSYSCLVASATVGTFMPAEWSLFASAGLNGMRYRGVWSYPPTDAPTIPYGPNDVVNVTVGPLTNTYVCIGVTLPSVSPPSADWASLYSSSTSAFASKFVYGTIHTEADYRAVGGVDGPYAGITLPYAGSAQISFTEVKVSDPTSGHGLCVLKFSRFARWLGSITLELPKISDGASLNWQATDVVLNAVNAGTITSYGSVSTFNASTAQGYVSNGTLACCRLNTFDTNKVTITNPNKDSSNVYMAVAGFQVY